MSNSTYYKTGEDIFSSNVKYNLDDCRGEREKKTVLFEYLLLTLICLLLGWREQVGPEWYIELHKRVVQECKMFLKNHFDEKLNNEVYFYHRFQAIFRDTHHMVGNCNTHFTWFKNSLLHFSASPGWRRDTILSHRAKQRQERNSQGSEDEISPS